MRLENRASQESVKQHMASINALFDTTGYGESRWNSLTKKEREFFCIQAGLQPSTADIPLSKIRYQKRKQLLLTIKALGRASAMFSNVPLCDFGE